MASSPIAPGGGGGGDVIPGATKLLKVQISQAELIAFPRVAKLLLPAPGAGKAYILTRVVYHQNITRAGFISTNTNDTGIIYSSLDLSVSKARVDSDIDSVIWGIRAGDYFQSRFGEFRYFVDFTDYVIEPNLAVWFAAWNMEIRGSVKASGFRTMRGSINMEISYGVWNV